MTVPEFSRLFPVRADRGEIQFEVAADAHEREALAERFGLVSVDLLVARGTITPLAGGRRARLEGRIEADVVQSCVVTLEPVPAHIEDGFELTYDREAGARERREVVVRMEEEEELPEPLGEEGIDVGEAAAECLGLALNPYPRAPGAEVERQAEEGPERAESSPFSVLRKLKGGKG